MVLILYASDYNSSTDISENEEINIDNEIIFLLEEIVKQNR